MYINSIIKYFVHNITLVIQAQFWLKLIFNMHQIGYYCNWTVYKSIMNILCKVINKYKCILITY